jgi:hypothetical protein
MARNFSTPDVTGADADGAGRRVGIVCARWNRTVTDRLLRGATHTLAPVGNAVNGDIFQYNLLFRHNKVAKVALGEGR